MGPRIPTPAELVCVLGLCTIAAACSPKPDTFTTPSLNVTYALTGTVTDATTGAPLQGVIVEARAHPDQSAPVISGTITGTNGIYRLVNLPSGAIHVRVDKYRYEVLTERLDLAANGARSFAIAQDPNPVNLTGSYTLTVEADAACASAAKPLPPFMRLRTFSVRIEQALEKLRVEIGSSCCVKFGGTASNRGAVFALTGGPFDGVLEDLEDFVEPIVTLGFDGHLVFLGTATTQHSATGLSGSLNGTITFYPVKIPGGRQPATGACGGGRFELIR